MFEYLFCADESSSFLNLRFENDVKMYGTQTQVRVSDSEGNAMNQGDTIVLRIDTEDILCVFKGIESGYFITETCEDGIRNRYRVKSIKKSKVVKNASVDAADEEE